jgi:prevent-host-death family protein
MEVNIHDAKTHLSKLIEQAEKGEEVIIARAGKPVVRLIALPAQPPKRSLLGCGVGKMWISEDFASEKTDQEIASLLDSGDDEFFTK